VIIEINAVRHIATERAEAEVYLVETVVDGIVERSGDSPDPIRVDRARIPEIRNFSPGQIRHATSYCVARKAIKYAKARADP
jgi:hypothetical protein